MVEILRRATKITQPCLQGFTVDVSGVYPALRPFDRISLSGGGGRGKGGKGGRGERRYRSTRRSWIFLLSSPGYHQKRHLGT